MYLYSLQLFTNTKEMVITPQALPSSTSEEDCYYTPHVDAYDNVDGLKDGNGSARTMEHRLIPDNCKIFTKLLY